MNSKAESTNTKPARVKRPAGIGQARGLLADAMRGITLDSGANLNAYRYLQALITQSLTDPAMAAAIAPLMLAKQQPEQDVNALHNRIEMLEERLNALTWTPPAPGGVSYGAGATA